MEKDQNKMYAEVIEYVNSTVLARERIAELEKECKNFERLYRNGGKRLEKLEKQYHAANEAYMILMTALYTALPDLRPTDPMARRAITILKDARAAAKEARHEY